MRTGTRASETLATCIAATDNHLQSERMAEYLIELAKLMPKGSYTTITLPGWAQFNILAGPDPAVLPANVHAEDILGHILLADLYKAAPTLQLSGS